MKIHLLPPLPPVPPAATQKTPPTAFQIEQMTEELVETARYWRAQREKIRRVHKDPRRPDRDAGSSESVPDKRSSKGKVNLLA